MKFLLLVAFIGVCSAATLYQGGRNIVLNGDYDAVVNGLIPGFNYYFTRQPDQKYIDIVINGVDTPAKKIQINPYTCQVINLEGYTSLPTQYTKETVVPQVGNYYYFFDILRNYQGSLDNYRYGQFLNQVQTGVQQGQVCQSLYYLLNYLDRIIDEDFVQQYFKNQVVSKTVGDYYPTQSVYGNNYGLYSWLGQYFNQYLNQNQNGVYNYGYYPSFFNKIFGNGYYGQQYSSVYPYGQQYTSGYPYGQQYNSVYPYGQQYSSVYPYGQQYSSAYPYGQQYSSVYPYGQQYSSVYPYGQQYSSVYPYGQQYSSVYPYGQQYSSVYPYGKSYLSNYLLGKQYQGGYQYEGYTPSYYGYQTNYVQNPLYAY